MMIDLMVTADDFGVNNARDEGILKLLQLGALTHVSLLVNGSSTQEAARAFREAYPSSSSSTQAATTTTNVGGPAVRRVYFNAVDSKDGDHSCGGRVAVAYIAPRCGHPSIGLHFNITEGPPLSTEMKNCDALVYFDAELNSFRFRGKAHNLVALDALVCCEGYITKNDVVAHAVQCELNAQLDAFFELTSTSSLSDNKEDKCWVDGHHHVHVTGVVHTLLQAHTHVLGTRSPRDFSLISQGNATEELGTKLFWKESDCFGPPFWAHLASKSIHNTSATKMKLTTDYFIGLDMMGSACSVEALHSRLRTIWASRIPSTTTLTSSFTPSHIPTVEVMTHVGYPVTSGGVDGEMDGSRVVASQTDPFYHDDFSRSEERRHEYRVYRSTCPE